MSTSLALSKLHGGISKLHVAFNWHLNYFHSSVRISPYCSEKVSHIKVALSIKAE